MKTSSRIVGIILLLCVIFSCLSAFTSCDTPTTTTKPGGNPPELVDYASQVKLDLTSNRARQEVTLHMHIDGDTSHFDLQTEIGGSKLLKARYLAVDTPESTGAIEKWGKAASNFTKERLQNAVSIIVESDTSEWNPDSTGSRYMVWVWYKTAEMSDYKNLNIEILQAGLAKSKGTDNVYGEVCFNAYMQARTNKLYLFSNDVDPDYHDGDAIPVDLKELATNPAKYENMKVVFEGVITRDFGNSIYLEAYSEETGMYHGISAFYGYQFNGMDLLEVGNLIKVVGKVTYYEGGGIWQVSDLKYHIAMPNHVDNIKLISEGHNPAYTLTDPAQFCNGTVDVIVKDEDGEEILKTFKYAELAINTTIEMRDLYVKSVHTTVNSENSKGAMTLTCTAPDGSTIIVRTEVLKDGDGNIVTESYFKGKTIDVKGLVGYYNGYQIKLISLGDVVVR